MRIELTPEQINLLRYAAEYKLEQDEEGDGMPDKKQRACLVRAVNILREALQLGPTRFV